MQAVVHEVAHSLHATSPEMYAASEVYDASDIYDTADILEVCATGGDASAALIESRQHSKVSRMVQRPSNGVQGSGLSRQQSRVSRMSQRFSTNGVH